MKRSLLQFILLIFILSNSLLMTCQKQVSEDPLLKELDVYLDSLLANTDLSACSVGIIHREEKFILHKGTLLDETLPNDATLYEIASLTKTFTGTLLAYAIQEGKVKLEDDIRQYLAADFPNLAYGKQGITFFDLVTHQSGLPNLFPDKKELFDDPDWDQLPFQLNELQKNFSRDDFFDELSKVELDTLPGVRFNYSNVGANLLGYLLEEIYEQPYADLLQKKIFSPLNLSNTYIAESDFDLNLLATGQNSNGVEMPFRAEQDMDAAGGIVSNVEDMLKYLRFHLQESKPVVSIAHQHLWGGKFGDFETGFFWQINKKGAAPDWIFQNGGAYGTSSWATLIPEQTLAVFLVTNLAGPDVHQVLSETVDQVIRQILLKK